MTQRYCRIMLLTVVYLSTTISQYYTALMHTEGKQFAKLMSSYSSKILTLWNACNFLFIKTCWVSESNWTASGWYAQTSSRAGSFRTVALASWVMPEESSCCTPWSSRPGTSTIHHQELETPLPTHRSTQLVPGFTSNGSVQLRLLHFFPRLDLPS